MILRSVWSEGLEFIVAFLGRKIVCKVLQIIQKSCKKSQSLPKLHQDWQYDLKRSCHVYKWFQNLALRLGVIVVEITIFGTISICSYQFIANQMYDLTRLWHAIFFRGLFISHPGHILYSRISQDLFVWSDKILYVDYKILPYHVRLGQKFLVDGVRLTLIKINRLQRKLGI